MKHDQKTLKQLLCAPFLASEIEWRLQWNNDTTGLAVPYLTNRAIQNRLDEVVGPLDWKNEFKPWHHFTHKGKEIVSQLCGLAIYHDDRKEWTCKWDGAETSDIEPVKGGLSDSMKRSAVEWGMGRFLYQMDAVFVDVERTKSGKIVIPDREYRRLDQVYEEMLSKIKANTPIPLVNRLALEKGALEQAPPGGAPVPASAAAPKATTAQVEPKQATAVPPPRPAPIPENVYEVTNVVLQKTISGGCNSHLFFRDQGGKVMDAFAQGVDELVVKGTLLANVRLSQKQSGVIAYYTMDHYEILPANQQAAA